MRHRDDAVVHADLRLADEQDLGVLHADRRRWPLSELPVAVLDFETTGVEPETCWPVSVAVVHLELHQDAELPRVVLDTLLKVPHQIPEEAVAIHGITDDMASTGLSLPASADALKAVLSQRVLCVYNLPYDITILERLMAAAGHPLPEPRGIDPLVWVKHVDKYQKGKKLGDACRRRGIPEPGHKAADDAMATARLLCQLMRGADPEWRTFGDLWKWQVGTAQDQERDYTAWCARNGKPPPSIPWMGRWGPNEAL